MKPTIKVSWEDVDGKNQVIISDWEELLDFLCANNNSVNTFDVEIFEQYCMECPIVENCKVWDNMP